MIKYKAETPCEECLTYVLCKYRKTLTCATLYHYVVDNHRCPPGFTKLRIVYYSNLRYLYADVKRYIKTGGNYD